MSFLQIITKSTIAFCAVVFITSTVSVQASSFAFAPTGKQFLEGCRSAINIDVDPQGGSSNAADIEIAYNPSEITVLDSDSNIPGVQIKPGNAYESYFGNEVNSAAKMIRLAGGSFVGQLTTKKTFATIEFVSNPNVATTSFQIKFDGAGATLDSNVADTATSTDTLTSVQNGSYTFTKGDCVNDTEAPKIIFQNPVDLATGVKNSPDFKVRITDNQSGVDLSSVVFLVNGDTYKITDPEVSYTGQPLDYTFTIRLRTTLPDAEKSTMKATAKDLKGNTRSADIVFNIPEMVCPIPDPDTINNNSTTTNVNNTSTNQPGILQSITAGNSFLQNVIDQSVFPNNTAIETFGKAALELLSILLMILTALVILLALFGRKLFHLYGVALDIKSHKVIGNTQVQLSDIDSHELIAETSTNVDGVFGFQVRPGIYQATVHNKNTYFVKNYHVPGALSVSAFDSEYEEAKKDGWKGMLTYIWRRIQWLMVRLLPGVLAVSMLFAIIVNIIFPSFLNLLLLAILIFVSVYSYFRKSY